MILSVNERLINIYAERSAEKRPLIIFNAGGNDGAEVFNMLKEMTAQAFVFADIPIQHWQDDLSPWPADPVIGNQAFGGQADLFLQELDTKIIPAITNSVGNTSECIIAGYSLAGLFALYAASRCDIFTAVMSASGSLWYPGFCDYLFSRGLSPKVRDIYLSLGDEEYKGPGLMAQVQDKTAEICAYLSEDHNCLFELNPGNHFHDGPGRCAKGLAWLLDQKSIGS